MSRPPLGVALVGYGFMGAAHSQAWRVAPRFFELPVEPRMSVIVGRDRLRVEAAAERFGWAESETDWRRMIERDDIDLVDICSPGATHVEIAIAALEAGKHVLCEKPLANTVAEAQRMAEAAERAAARGVYAMVGFSYRRVPAITFARDLVAAGRIGELRQVRALYLQDWLVDAEGPMTWRLDKDLAGSGSLGDIGAHAIDAVQFITGRRVKSVSGILETLVTERPLLGESIGLSGTASSERGRVTVDDVALFTARLDGGVLGSFEATRYATGRKNAFRLEFSGSKGAIAFAFERMNELEFYDVTDPAGLNGFRRILVTEPEHPYMAAWWPTGHGIGYEHPFSHQVRDLVVDIAAGTQPRPSFDDGLQVQRVLEAVEISSAAGSSWIPVVHDDSISAGGQNYERLSPSDGETRMTSATPSGRNALIVRGGWDGHQPVETTNSMIPFLERNGFTVRIEESPAVYTDADYLETVDLILQINTMASITKDEFAGLQNAVLNGTGMGGWHGGIADSYRNNADYLHMIGGQFAHHAGKDPAERTGEQSDNYIPYTMHITDLGRMHPITRGIDDFDLVTEQYWVLSDEYNDVLATTTQTVRPWDAWNRPVTAPAIWTRQWGKGRIFVSAPGHRLEILDDPNVRTIVERGLLWAAR